MSRLLYYFSGAVIGAMATLLTEERRKTKSFIPSFVSQPIRHFEQEQLFLQAQQELSKNQEIINRLWTRDQEFNATGKADFSSVTAQEANTGDLSVVMRVAKNLDRQMEAGLIRSNAAGEFYDPIHLYMGSPKGLWLMTASPRSWSRTLNMAQRVFSTKTSMESDEAELSRLHLSNAENIIKLGQKITNSQKLTSIANLCTEEARKASVLSNRGLDSYDSLLNKSPQRVYLAEYAKCVKCQTELAL